MRENTLLAVGARNDTVVYDHADGVTLELYALGDGRSATCTVSGDQGEPLVVTAQRQGSEIVVTAAAARPWRLLAVGQGVTCDQSQTVRNERGTLIEGKPSLRLTLSAG